jgi:tetratricopeptide (TPR) repeat protein
VRQGVEKKEINELHLRFASYFSTQAKWAMALHHYIKSEAWEEAVEHLKNHGDELLQSELPEEIVEWLDGLPNHLLRTHGHLTRLRAEAYVRLGELDAAIHSYQEFLAHKQVTPADAVETARYYQELAEVHHKKGELGEALGYQRMGMSILEDDKDNLDALQAYEAIGALHQKRGSREAALRWGGRILNVAQKLRAQKRIKLLPQNRKPLGLLVAFAIGGGLWQIPPPTSLDESGMHFLASLVVRDLRSVCSSPHAAPLVDYIWHSPTRSGPGWFFPKLLVLCPWSLRTRGGGDEDRFTLSPGPSSSTPHPDEL